MEEFCGYKSLDGSLHETEESCREADLKFRTNEIKKKFSKIDDLIRDKIWHLCQRTHGNANVNISEIEDILIYIFANKKKELLEIYNQGDLLKKELDILHESYNKTNYSFGNWWLKFKWWE